MRAVPDALQSNYLTVRSANDRYVDNKDHKL